MTYYKALRKIRAQYKQTEEKKDNNLICKNCQISFLTAQKYKVLNCNTSENLRHSFISFAKNVELRRLKNWIILNLIYLKK